MSIEINTGKVDHWISVDHAYPIKSMKVKIKNKDGREDWAFWYSDHKEFGTIDPLFEDEITHWYPLPE